MARNGLTNEELRKSPYEKLAKDAENHALRQKLYQFRSLDKRGRELAETIGVNFDTLSKNEEN